MFEDKESIYHIDNEIGYIYIGDGSKWHEVIKNDNFFDERITIGFDIMIKGAPSKNLSHIPIIY